MMYDRQEALDLSRCRVALIVNGKAGKRDAQDRLHKIRTTLEPVVGELMLCPVRKGAEIAPAARAAVAQGADVVAALGGDGTQAAVAGALVNSGAAMAVLPGGTFNYFARELGVETMDQALDALMRGQVLARDVGQINDRIFLNNASIGLYPHILASRETIYRRWGRSRVAAYWSVLVGLRNLRRPMRLQVASEGELREFVTPMAFVARSAFQLESLGLDGAEAVRNGQFALFVARGQSRRALIAASVRLAMGRMARGEDFDLVVADGFQIQTTQKRKRVALDGEQGRLSAPLSLQVLRGALRVIAPVDTAKAALAGTPAV
ncbi:diacylglycerol/lipid kinase family protein [Pseudotabrizicola sp. L79]|uniref:diacylglycerol/lipid kinase family protein n=1 Tax=Pseudotabrizicola sp. L79 TaxID=3118402 RepID=UPI002F92B0A4